MSKVFEMAKKLLKKGFFHVAGSNIINKIVTAVTNILVANFLGKFDYGVFGAAYNIYSIFIISSGLGMYAAILVYCSENRSIEEKRGYYSYGIKAGFYASIMLSVLMFAYGVFVPLGIQETREYILLLSALPILDYLVQYVLVIFRSQKMNRQYALYTNILSISYMLLGCLGAKLFGIRGTILGRYFSYITVLLFTIKIAWPYIYAKGQKIIRLSKEKIKDLWTFSLKNGASSALNQLLYLIDIALLTALIKNPEVIASYKVAVLIPEGLSFIPTSMMVFLVPIIAEHSSNGTWLRSNIKKLLLLSGLMNLIITLLLVLLAPYIISLLWGKEYLDSVPCFRILSVNYFFMATFRMSCTNILAILRKVNFNLVLGIVSGILDVVLDYILIKNFSSIGAAVATLTTVIFITCFSVPYLVKTLKKIN